MKKRGLGLLLVAVFLVGLFFVVACVGPSKEVRTGAMSVVVTTPIVENDGKAKVVFYGTGFAPKQKIRFSFLDQTYGVSTIIDNALEPDPIPNEEGAWVTVWDTARYRRIIKPGTIMMRIVDKDSKVLVQVPVAFVAPPKEEKK